MCSTRPYDAWSRAGVKTPERIGSGPAKRLTEAESRAWVAARTVRPSDDGEPLGLGSRQAVHGRRERGRLIGFVNGRRGMLFPRGQFDDHGRVPQGLGKVLGVFDGDGWEAWSWLNTPSAALDDERPLERLWKGETERVVAAARGHRQGDFG